MFATRGDFGRLGHGDCNDVFIPQPIRALSGRSIVKVACGDTHTLAVTAEGELFSFGRNQNGQLGLGTTNDALLPQLVESLKVITLSRLIGFYSDPLMNTPAVDQKHHLHSCKYILHQVCQSQ